MFRWVFASLSALSLAFFVFAFVMATALKGYEHRIRIGTWTVFVDYWPDLRIQRPFDRDDSVHVLFVLLVTAALPLAWYLEHCYQQKRRRDRARNDQCSKCGFDLRASKERCPECGEAIRLR